MDNKSDWDEIEKWNTQRIINEKEKSKFYNEKFRKNKKIENITKGLKITGIIIRVLTHIILLIAIFIGISILATRIASKL